MREIWIRIEFNLVDKDMKHGGLKKKNLKEKKINEKAKMSFACGTRMGFYNY